MTYTAKFDRGYYQNWYQQNKARLRREDQRDQWKSRLGAIIVLGGKCAHCGYCANDAALQIDHIVPLLDHTRSNIRSQRTFYRNIINGARDNLQVLCANCHIIKTRTENPQLLKVEQRRNKQ